MVWIPAYDEFRTFAIEPIERLSVTDDTFKRTRDLPATLFGSSMGVFTGEAERIENEFESRVAVFGAVARAVRPVAVVTAIAEECRQAAQVYATHK